MMKEKEEEEQEEGEGVGLDHCRDPQTDGSPRKQRGGQSQSTNPVRVYCDISGICISLGYFFFWWHLTLTPYICTQMLLLSTPDI